MPPTGYPGKKTNNGIGGVTIDRAQFEAEKAASDSMYDHETHADPHGQYQKESEKGQPNGYASLDGTGDVPDEQIPDTIARDSELHTRQHVVTDPLDHVFPGGTTNYLREDGTWSAPTGGGGGTNLDGGTPSSTYGGIAAIDGGIP